MDDMGNLVDEIESLYYSPANLIDWLRSIRSVVCEINVQTQHYCQYYYNARHQSQPFMSLSDIQRQLRKARCYLLAGSLLCDTSFADSIEYNRHHPVAIYLQFLLEPLDILFEDIIFNPAYPPVYWGQVFFRCRSLEIYAWTEVWLLIFGRILVVLSANTFNETVGLLWPVNPSIIYWLIKIPLDLTSARAIALNGPGTLKPEDDEDVEKDDEFLRSLGPKPGFLFSVLVCVSLKWESFDFFAVESHVRDKWLKLIRQAVTMEELHC